MIHSLRSFWLGVPAAVVLLFSATAPALCRMTCVMSGHQVVHIGVGKDCCPQPNGKHGAHLSATCCVFAHTVPQRSEYTAPNFRAVHPVEAIPLFLPAGNATSTDLAASRGPIVTRPPPLLRAERSSRLRSFLI